LIYALKKFFKRIDIIYFLFLKKAIKVSNNEFK